MAKKREPILFKIFLWISLFLLIEAAVLLYFSNPGSITGHSVEGVSNLYSKFYPSSKNFLVVQWSIIAVIIIFVYLKNSKIHKRNKTVTNIDVNKAINDSKTSLDALYLILQKEKSLDLKTVADLFEIKIDLAMEWARVLESGDLVTIDYPGIGSPVINVVEKKIVEEKLLEKEKEKISPTVLLKEENKPKSKTEFKGTKDQKITKKVNKKEEIKKKANIKKQKK